MWGEQDSNLRRHTPADLQSAPVGRFGISPDIPLKFIPGQNFQLWSFPDNVKNLMSRMSDSNWRPRDYKSRALANWANSASG